MKQIYKYITILFFGMLALCACTDESELQGLVVEKGEDVTLTLNFRPETNKQIVNSRATADENKLYDLHFYVFNASSGELTGYEKIASIEAGTIISPTANVEIRTKTGRSYIYAVANICEGNTYNLIDGQKVDHKGKLDLYQGGSGSTLSYVKKGDEDWYVCNGSVDVDAIVKSVKNSFDLDDFKNIKFYRVYSSQEGENFSPKPIDNHYMMSGYLNDGAPVNITKGTNNTATIEGGDGVIRLYRILAKNTLTIKTNGKKVFTPKSYTFYNLPKSGKLVPKAGISNANKTSDYITDNTTDFGTQTENTLLEETTFKVESKNKVIEFFYPENLQPTTATIAQWKDRETNSYNSATGKKSFTNAPLNAAYLEIQGNYEDESTETSAEVTYTIHLGHFNTTKLNDFNVIRNNHYNYTVNINGVNDITAEAQLKGDNPYAEGLVIEVSSGQHYSVDAHYETRVMKFAKSSIKALKGENNGPGYILNFATPFGKTKETVNIRKINGKGYVYDMQGNQICQITQLNEYKNRLFEGELDYTWMKFVRNTTENTQGLNGIKGICEYPGNGHSSILNIYELLSELYDDNTYGNSEEIYYTCFIDENYYDEKDWIDYVNTAPRNMQIANDLSVSSDGKSIYARVAYSISQQSIQTFYTMATKKAFGTEFYDEEKRYNIRLGSSGSIAYYENLSFVSGAADDWSGFSATANTVKNHTWYTNENNKIPIINNVAVEPIQPMYQSAAKACMSRNRDKDGDGIIDEDEVKWYLASIDQYYALYFAKSALPEALWFIDEGTGNNDGDMYEMQQASRTWSDNGHDFRGRYHYYTSSEKGSAGTFWPEEGLTSNPVQTNNFMCRAELIRCVRTLVNKGEGRECPDRFYDFAEVKNNNNRVIGGTFTINSMNVGIRPNINGSLPLHNELITDINALPRKFQVATRLVNNNNHSVNTITGQENDPCSQYTEGGFRNWRTPNQKEMALMLAHMKDQLKEDQCITRTRFSCYNGDNGTESWYDPTKPKYSWHNRVGFKVNNQGNFNLVEGTQTGKIRCVRDVVE